MVWGAILGSLAGGLLASKGAKDAANTVASGQRDASAALAEAAERGRQHVFTALPVVENNLQLGQQAALNMLGGSITGQIGLNRGGNIAAQNTLLAGLPMANNALLGNPIDYSSLQAYQGSPIPEINTQLPTFQSISGAYKDKAAADMLAGATGSGNPALNQQAEDVFSRALAAEGWGMTEDGGVADTTGQGRTSADFNTSLSGIVGQFSTNPDVATAFGIGTAVAGPIAGLVASLGTAVMGAFGMSTGDRENQASEGSPGGGGNVGGMGHAGGYGAAGGMGNSGESGDQGGEGGVGEGGGIGL